MGSGGRPSHRGADAQGRHEGVAYLPALRGRCPKWEDQRASLHACTSSEEREAWLPIVTHTGLMPVNRKLRLWRSASL
eukprot:6606120-Heterocapsa_arctica.AAC.1